jgi:hypothetical protein
MNSTTARARRRPRSTPPERADWVRRFHRSGLTQREFADRHRLGLSTLQKWMAQRPAEPSSGRGAKCVWQELKLPAPPGAPRWAVELVRPDGLTLRVAPEAPTSLVAELLRVGPC